jgi:hypothetical protein
MKTRKMSRLKFEQLLLVADAPTDNIRVAGWIGGVRCGAGRLDHEPSLFGNRSLLTLLAWSVGDERGERRALDAAQQESSL